MKFHYEYRTSDNVSHDGIVNAASKDAAFALLKSQGIRASRMTEAPGFFNKLFGKGKRWIAIGLLAIIAAVALMLYFKASDTLQASQTFLAAQMRRQIIGDALIIEKGIRNGWADVFEHDGDRFLASFAVPGVPAGLRSTSEKELLAAASRKIEVAEDDGIEARQIKSMVEGMKHEMRRFLANGGTVSRYGERLVRRQEEELGYYNRAKAELEAAQKSGLNAAELEALWEKRNASLRAMGIKLISMPE